MDYAKRMRRYLNQTVTWVAVAGADAYGKPTKAPAVDIPARKELKTRLVRNALGNDVVSTTTVYCQQAVKPQDEIGDVLVLSVADWVDGGGHVVGWEVYL